ncbi:ABC transporter ATP-binding protein [Pandoraea pulmonicola]|uniref:Bicarbonate transport ATP-binding protein CmpD n=2 Tax=Pandoraea pulmonicola TaxID=93221 RepID=A0AAJ4ZBK9_PANPU|nr:ABC transporter ATP-binding protein [Pandoraea pulmonicola]SUA90309.1 Bicarbonate transport ATP-binding protein CmpD [Pandoraea pulmonicola]
MTSQFHGAQLHLVDDGRAPQASHAPHVVLTGVTKNFRTPDPKTSRKTLMQALGPVDLTLRKGEFFSVVGPSGCGKSTLLELIAGLAVPSDGLIQFEGRPVTGVPDGVGVVFQEDASFPWLTVRENIGFGLRMAGVDSAEIDRRVGYALGFMGLRDFANARPAQLSGGMRQRMCIARTLVIAPRLILLDEPFGALDQQTRMLMGDELLRLWRETSATVLLITHALDEAAVLSDRVGVMSSRPGRFIDVIETGWERNRDSRIVAAPRFGEITARLWDTLRAESLKAMHGGEGASAGDDTPPPGFRRH